MGDSSRPARDFPLEERPNGFDNEAAALSVSPVLLEAYLTAAEGLAASAIATGLPKLLGCDPAKGQDACARSFIDTFTRRAFRGPVATVERDAYFALYKKSQAAGDFEGGIRQALTAILLAPQFLYRVEMGGPAAPGARTVALTGPELATRLSYLLWKTMPDDRLLSTAEAGGLSTPAGLNAEVMRMLEDPRALGMVADFHAQWLEVARLDHVSKDPVMFPKFTPVIAGRLREEIRQFVDHVFTGDGGSLTTLLTAPYTFVDKDLALYYGMADRLTETRFVKTPTDGRRRAGVLTQGGIMAMLAAPDHTDPVVRGKYVRENFLCQTLPPPPEGLEVMLPPAAPNQTTRQRFAAHANNPACSGCHQLMDPVGLGFESFDAAGVWRDKEAGAPVDARGQVVDLPSIGAFEGATELAGKLARAPEVQVCMVKLWFRYGYGRVDQGPVDACTLATLNQQFAVGGHRMRDLIVALTKTETFRSRRVTTIGGQP